MARARNYCFTLNNYTQEEYEALKELECPYIIMGLETGENGTKHIQGYVEFKLQRSILSLKKINKRIHWESRKGTPKQASDYCRKTDLMPFIKGELKAQGSRNDLAKIKLEVNDKGMREIANNYNLQGIRYAEKYLSYCEAPRDWKPMVYWIHGATGTGKSKRARELLKDNDTFTKNDGTKWWDGYDRHEAVIIDDFRPSWWPLTYMLALIDRYEFRIEFKGGHRQFVSKVIVITSAFAPNECYTKTNECIKQLERRIDEVIKL